LDCPFCEIPEKNIIKENKLCLAVYDKYPVSKGHMLIITKRHVKDYFAALKTEKSSLLELMEECRIFLKNKYKPDGYNVGLNCGAAAGQTIMHLHLHLIPRYINDIDDPTGGVRGVIPAKRIYRSKR
jgi:diadenosine tetraphosphate (Ap4A) HIT family hydrolase